MDMSHSEITLDRRGGGNVGGGEPDIVGDGDNGGEVGDVGISVGEEVGGASTSVGGAVEKDRGSLLLTFSISVKGAMLW